MARRLAVIGYSFERTEEKCAEAEQLHPGHTKRIAQIHAVIRTNGQGLTVDPLIDMVDAYLRMRGWSRSGQGGTLHRLEASVCWSRSGVWLGD